MPAFLLQPLITLVATEVIKWLVEVIGPEVPALASKWVALGVSALLTWVGAQHLPVDLGPILNPYIPAITTAVSAGLAYVLHDIATAIAQIAKIPQPPAPKVLLSVGK